MGLRMLAVPVVSLAVLVACDDDGAGFGATHTGLPYDSGTWGTSLGDSGTTTTRSDGMGTQVGSEGFWGCPIETVREIAGDVVVDELGATPMALVAEAVGGWPLQIKDAAAVDPVVGSLQLAESGTYLWVDVADGCADHLAVTVQGTLERQVKYVQPVSGLVAISATERKLLVTVDADVSGGTPGWPGHTFAAGIPVTFRVDGALTPTTLTGAASYVDCAAVEVTCPTAQVVADVTGAR